MWTKYLNRFLVFSLILVFTFALSVPVFAAGNVSSMPGYIFLLEQKFYESSFVEDGDNYKVPAFTPDYELEHADSCLVSYCGQSLELPWYGYTTEDGQVLYCIGNVTLYDPDQPAQADNGVGFFLALYKGDKAKSFFICSSDFFRDYIEDTHVAGFTISFAVPKPSSLTFLDKLFSIFSDVGVWLRSQLGFVIDLFWNAEANQLTFFGVLSLISLGFSVVLLLIKVILNFLHFRS